MTFKWQIINKSFCSTGMSHVSSSVLLGLYLSGKIICCLSEVPVTGHPTLYLATLLKPQTTQKVPPPRQMLVEFFVTIRRETQEDPLHPKLGTANQSSFVLSWRELPSDSTGSQEHCKAWSCPFRKNPALIPEWLGIGLISSVVINFPNSEMTWTLTMATIYWARHIYQAISNLFNSAAS